MPGLVRKLLIFAAVDGLILQPLGGRRGSQTIPQTAVKINYNTHTLSSVRIDYGSDLAGDAEKLEAHGIVGILKVASSAYLISISRRQQVAQLWGKPVYQITGVELIPISSQREAQQAISDARETARIKHEKETGHQGDHERAAAALLEADDENNSDEGVDSLEHSDAEFLNEARPRRPSADGPVGSRSSIDTRKETSIAEEVIGRKGAYGRFTEKWFSKRGWATGQRRNMGLSSEDDLPGTQEKLAGVVLSKTEPDSWQRGEGFGHSGRENEEIQALEGFQRWPQTTPKVEKTFDEAVVESALPDNKLAASLLPKLVQTTKLLFGSRTFYFSYDHDITRSAAQQMKPTTDLTLHKRVDSQYFYNHHLIEPLIGNGYDEFVLPIMQGFVGQRTFAVGDNPAGPSSPKDSNVQTPQTIVDASSEDLTMKGEERRVSERSFLLTLISRRSIKRAGLRYLRRGIDEDGNVANSVETEQLLSTPAWDDRVQWFLQTRGSIPLFFSQTPYTFKPLPVLYASAETNQAAFRKHFASLATRYGSVEAVSLIDRHGTEEKIGETYEEQVSLLNKNGGINGMALEFEWFNFHKVCRGMKFENVSILVQKLLPYLTNSSWTVLEQDTNKPIQRQSGIIRTNCMDCLDRTNVVQSAFAQTILELQLSSFPSSPVTIDLTSDPTTSWFNSLWADNGDAISRAYAGTSALKGDYTRTRRRNALGALNDLSLTLSRYYHNLFDDFFQQAAIDYLLGTVTAAVFTEFEAEMTSADPALDLRKARESAITTATHIVVAEDEDFVGGWALATPAAHNSLRSFPFRESLLLVTDAALYMVRFDWGAEKVSGFERIGLDSVKGVQRGTYVTRTHAASQTDPAHNVGLVVRYLRPRLAGEHPQSDDGAPPAAAAAAAQDRVVRLNTRALENARDAWSVTGVDGHHEDGADGRDAPEPPLQTQAGRSPGGGEEETFMAFKALPPRNSAVRRTDADIGRQPSAQALPLPLPSELDAVEQICDEIVRAVNLARRRNGADEARSGEAEEEDIKVEERDILSLEEAKKKTGVLETLGYSIRKFVWG